MIFGAVLVIALSLVSIRSAFVSAVALEQTARCGAEEHCHTAVCYENNRLHCGKNEHTHNRNCYLVLLKDNDINSLLSYIDRDESHSLEALIYRTVDTAIQYNEDLALANKPVNPVAQTVLLTTPPSDASPPQPTPPAVTEAITESPEATQESESQTAVSMQDVNISDLNETITEQSIEPNLILNENLYNAAAVSSTPGDTVALLGAVSGSGGASTFAVGDSQVDNTYTANFFINLDTANNWVCIGNLPFERVSGTQNNRYNLRIRTADIVELVNEALGTSYTASNFRLKYSTSANSQSWTATTLGSDYTIIGSNIRSQNSTAARYLRITNSDGKDVQFYTVTFQYSDGTEEKIYVKNNDTITLPEGSWKTGDTTYSGEQTYQVTKATTFVDQLPATYTVTYQYPNGSTSTETVTKGTEITLPIDYTWTANGTLYEGGERVTINSNTTFVGSIPVYYTVTYQYPDGSTSTETVLSGRQIQLPSGCVWTINGVSYSAGEKVTIVGDTICVGSYNPIQVSYTVNFPTSGYGYSSVSKPTATPTVEGMSGYAGTVTVPSMQGTTVRTVSQTLVKLDGNHGSYDTYTYPVLFRGWMSETGELISPHSNLSWQELLGYDKNGDNVVALTGVWEHGLNNTLSFFILLNSSVDQMSSSNVADYTDVVFSTFIGNANPNVLGKNPYKASTDAAALENDAQIRAMHGEQADSIWLYTFPKDEDIFDALKVYAQGRQLRVGNETVAVEDLNANGYAIRWYKVINENDGWHIDGKLTRKVGVIEVSKTFAGNDTLIGSAKNNFYITATNGSRTLTLNSGNDVDDGDGNPNTWLWRITDVKYDEEWTLTESPNTANNVIHYAEWSISDASANSQTSNGTGNRVTVRGVTYASDLADPEWLRVDFNNIYYHKDSLMIKKADGVTGEALTGATFQLYQNNTLMTFNFDAGSGMYVYDPGGNGAYSTLSGNGYMNIAADNFSYDNGHIVVREITAPTNYNPVGDIKVGYTDTGQTVGIIDPVNYAEYLDGLLVVYNSANTMNVTAEKIWECEESEWKDITVQLFANGSANLAATLTGSQSTQVDLTRSNGYRHTWTDLPIYAYGSRVDWSIKEIRVGSEDCKADYTFANWAVSYDAAVRDAEGNVTLAVHNTPKRPMLYLTKTNIDGTVQLRGATFSLTQVDSHGTPVSGFVTRTATTNDQGMLIFDNLLYGARYRIVEESAPPGYKLLDTPIHLTISEGGTVVVENHSNAWADAVAYNVVVTNRSEPPLPLTGGSGPGVSYGLGGAMMLLAACGYILLKPRERGRRQSSP